MRKRSPHFPLWAEIDVDEVNARTKPEAEEASRITDDDRQFWSFRPPVRPALPLIQHADRATTSIDAFLLSRLEERGLSFAADAPAEVMLRRGTFALTGMPPTPDEREAFLADGTADAYERLVDRLLASPRFGEHTARQWLDVRALRPVARGARAVAAAVGDEHHLVPERRPS